MISGAATCCSRFIVAARRAIKHLVIMLPLHGRGALLLQSAYRMGTHSSLVLPLGGSLCSCRVAQVLLLVADCPGRAGV